MTDNPIPRTWTDGDLTTANLLNTDLRDKLRFIVGTNQTSVKLTTPQSIPTTSATAISWDTESEDTDELITVPSSTFTFTRDGVMKVRARILWMTTSHLGSTRQAYLKYTRYGESEVDLNGVVEGGADEYLSYNISAAVPVGVGDQLKFYAYQDSGSSLNLGGNATLRWVGALDDWVDYDISPPDPAPGDSDTPTAVKYTKTYTATWSRTYDGFTGYPTTWDDSRYCYQGWYDKIARGNTRSLIGFNYNTIKSDLQGASNITMYFKCHIEHCYYSTGMTVLVGGHDYINKPSNWSDSRVDQFLQQKHGDRDTDFSLKLGSTLINGLKSGKYKGIALGPGRDWDRIYYGYARGATMTNPPKLTAVYWK